MPWKDIESRWQNQGRKIKCRERPSHNPTYSDKTALIERQYRIRLAIGGANPFDYSTSVQWRHRPAVHKINTRGQT